MIEILSSLGVDKRDLCAIVELYWGQIAEVKVENTKSEEVEIRHGVRQGCVLSPTLFIIYAERVFDEAINEHFGDIKINGELINNIRYADDTVILASSQAKLQQIMNNVVQHSEAYGLSPKISKTKVMVGILKEKS